MTDLRPGNVLVDPLHLGSPNETTLLAEESELLSAWTKWAASMGSTPAVMQINHPGRQSAPGAGTRSFFAKTVAPSAIPLDIGPGYIARAARALILGTPRALEESEIADVVAKFARAAALAAKAGFQGVQVHAAHGYLLAQFLSAKSNHRTDRYGGDARSRARIVTEVIHAVRQATPAGFCVGIKLNSADQMGGDASDVIEQVKMIVEAGVDFIEISGGSWEKTLVCPSMICRDHVANKVLDVFWYRKP
jgi:2,4-dienoyl-CoA reductase-like NADH-dependent reductase (Old Yellow Enzyme family)